MPLPKSPVIPGLEHKEIIFGAQQEEYIPLPALKSLDGKVMTRWSLTKEERDAIAEGADVIITLWTFNHPLMPMHVAVPSCSMDLSELAEQMGMFDHIPTIPQDISLVPNPGRKISNQSQTED